MDNKLFLGAIWKEVPVLKQVGVYIEAGLLGIVAKRSDGDESWRAYCGIILRKQDPTAKIVSNQEKEDIDNIVKHGAKLSEEEAQAWFPHIKLKYAQ